MSDVSSCHDGHDPHAIFDDYRVIDGAVPRFDDDGSPIHDYATCGTCGATWDDAATSGITPAPSGRCPFEYNHEDDDTSEEPWRGSVDARYA